MCGIVGVLNLTNPAPVDAELLRVANAALHHRCPDGSGEFVEADVGMAMRRQLSAGTPRGSSPLYRAMRLRSESKRASLVRSRL